MYYPVCTKEYIFERAVMAAVKNNMALVFQVWTNFGIGVSRASDRQTDSGVTVLTYTRMCGSNRSKPCTTL